MQDFDLDRLQESVTKCISQSGYGDAMVRIKSFVELVINDPESVGVVFASRELDTLCRTLADAYYGSSTHVTGEGRGTIILASELVRAGGHVELIKDYLALGLFESPVRVVLTDLFNRFDLATTAEWASLLGCEVLVAEQDALDAKLEAVSTWLHKFAPSTILTLGHNQDVVCVVAAHAPGATNRYYIHHGDHHLSLGVTCEAFRHVDLSNMAYELCRNETGVTQQLYWPISAFRSSEIKTKFLERGTLTTCSCGRMSKFETGSYALRYERAVGCILKASRGYHVHIGELSDEFLERIHSELDAVNISHDRFIHIEWVASLSRALIENAVDVFVSAIPIGGGKSLIEAMSAGVAVVTHESYRSRFYAGFDIAYPESYRWTGYEDLLRIFEHWSLPSLERHGESALQHFERYYSKDAFLRAYASGLDCASQVPPLRAHRGNPLLHFLDTKRRRAQEAERLELEKNQLFQEWTKVRLAYEGHGETIVRQQAAIRKQQATIERQEARSEQQQAQIAQLTEEKLAWEATFAGKVSRLIGTMRNKKNRAVS